MKYVIIKILFKLEVLKLNNQNLWECYFVERNLSVEDLNSLYNNYFKLKLNPNCLFKGFISNSAFKIEMNPSETSKWYGGRYNFTFHIPQLYLKEDLVITYEEQIYHQNFSQGTVYAKQTNHRYLCVVVNSVYSKFETPDISDFYLSSEYNNKCGLLMQENEQMFWSNVEKSLNGEEVDGIKYIKFR